MAVRLHSGMAALLMVPCVWAEARSDVGCAREVPREEEVDKTIPGGCFLGQGSGNSLRYPER